MPLTDVNDKCFGVIFLNGRFLNFGRPDPTQAGLLCFPKAIQLASEAQRHGNKSLLAERHVVRTHQFLGGPPAPGIELNGEETGISEAQVKREPVTLESMDYLTKKKKGRSKVWRPRE